MAKILPLIAALAVIVSAAFLFSCGPPHRDGSAVSNGFVQTRGSRFVVDGQPFRFAGANVAICIGMKTENGCQKLCDRLRRWAFA